MVKNGGAYLCDTISSSWMELGHAGESSSESQAFGLGSHTFVAPLEMCTFNPQSCLLDSFAGLC